MPFQPATRFEPEFTLYKEHLPDSRLAPYIYYYWEFKTIKPLLNGLEYRVVPNGCIDIYFELQQPSKSIVTGFSDKSSSVTLQNEFHYFGICFMPSVFPLIYNINATELTNRYFDLDLVAPNTANFITNELDAELSSSRIIDSLNTHFLNLTNSKAFRIDYRLLDAIDLIFKTGGNLSLDADLKTGLSQRQLRRLFNFYIGNNPKTFCKVVRFQSFLQKNTILKVAASNFDYLDYGYYDQSHFIKEFKTLFGKTPRQAY
tara:strand:- start:86228 stop:87004 length:777 start_codon:yes stop_codon:yes gene_type:complete